MKALILAAILLAFSAQAAKAVCNSEDGNVPYWSHVNYTGVQYGEVPVCRVGSNVPVGIVDHARAGWNNAASKELLVPSCEPYVGLVLLDVPDGTCDWAADGRPNPACGDMPTMEQPELLRMRIIESVASLYSESEQKTLVSHEMGHTLGFFHLSGCDSIMGITPDGYGCYNYTQPSPLDVLNYHNAYDPDVPTNFAGSSSSPADAFLAWSQMNPQGEVICNESGFTVFRNSTQVQSLPKDSNWVELSDQPYGEQSYAIQTETGALYRGQVNRAQTDVDVFGPVVGGLFIFGPSPVQISSTQGRYMWFIADIRNSGDTLLNVVVRAGQGASTPIGCSSLKQLILPATEETTVPAGGERRMLYRFRYECHAPATPQVKMMHPYLGVREVNETVEDCREGQRQLIVSN